MLDFFGYGIAFSLFFGIGSAFFFGVVMVEKKVAPAVVCFAIVCLMFLSISAFAFNFGRAMERTLNPAHRYVVLIKGQSDRGEPLLVYDTTDRKNRVVAYQAYPPKGFDEVITVNGDTMIIPVAK